MRYLSVLLIFFCLKLSVSYGQDQHDKIGFVDQQYIFENLPEFKKLNLEIITKSQQYDKILKEKYDEFEAKSVAFEKLVAGKSEQTILRDKALELENLKKSYEDFQANSVNELREYYIKKFTPIRQKVNDAIIFAGRQKNYAFVLRMDLNPDGGDIWPVVLYARDSTANLSADILKNLGIDSTSASIRKIGIPQMLKKK
ncbi:OmpH family outer membrane protein [Dyadobacter sp. NIV53]|uniref:OmpH family outer membrane protein n=1 Tax=Dyadobacter sp. NIV53 TaxID=2861765 RepID=UPI001C87218B|nr:OmpH family outer membrane protein [Dyadobacter sp. NIV53]